jgi:catechol 2,3-dioxygenase-like lactoylglutathione lyase family enzyme
MKTGLLEHVNVTVSNPQETADLMCRLFDWHIRWSGRSAKGGDTIHVGTDAAYLAVYSPDLLQPAQERSGSNLANLNHIGVVVDDLDAVEARVLEAGLKPHLHGDYEPGRRFYFDDENGIEFEVVSYA